MDLRSLAITIAAVMTMVPAITSCSSDACYENRTCTPIAGFYDSYTTARIGLDSLEIYGVGAPDSALLVKTGTRTSQTYLPLRHDNSSTTFVIHYAYKVFASDAYNDTITLQYTSSPYFASSECGVMYRYRIESADWTRHLIDSVKVVSPDVVNIQQENIQIYFRTEAEEGEADA